MTGTSGRWALLWDRALEAALLVAAFALPVSFYLKTYDSALVKDLALQAATALALGFALLRALAAGRVEVPAPRAPLAALAAALLAWTGVSFGLNSWQEVSLLAALRSACGPALLLLVLCGPGGSAFAARLTDWLLSAAGLAGGYALAQRLGLDPLIWKGAFGTRAFSTFGNPDHLGVFLAAAVPLALGRSMDPEAPRWRRGLSLLCAATAAAGLACSGSAPGLVALAVSSAVFAGMGLHLWRSPALRGLCFLALALVPAALGASLALSPAGSMERAARAVAERREVWASGRVLAAARPLAGWGAGSFPAAVRPYRTAGHSRLTRAPRFHYHLDSAQSTPLELACELGLLGLGLWAGLWAWLLWAGLDEARRRARDGEVPEAGLLLAQLCAAAGLLAAGAASGALQSPGLWGTLWLLGGSAAALALERGSARVRVLPIPLSPASRAWACVPVAGLALAALVLPARFFLSDMEHNAGVWHARGGRAAEAVARFDRVWSWHSSGAMARYFAGNLLSEQLADAEGALARYSSAAALAPGYAPVHYRKGVLYARASRWPEAAASLREAARLDPFLAPALAKLVEAETALGRREEARRAALALLAAQPEEPRNWIVLAETYRELKKTSVAWRMFQRAQRVEELARGAPGPGDVQ